MNGKEPPQYLPYLKPYTLEVYFVSYCIMMKYDPDYLYNSICIMTATIFTSFWETLHDIDISIDQNSATFKYLPITQQHILKLNNTRVLQNNKLVILIDDQLKAYPVILLFFLVLKVTHKKICILFCNSTFFCFLFCLFLIFTFLRYLN